MQMVEEEEEEQDQGQKTGPYGESMSKSPANPRDTPPACRYRTPFPHLTGQRHPRLCSWGELETTASNYCYHHHGDYDGTSVSHSA